MSILEVQLLGVDHLPLQLVDGVDGDLLIPLRLMSRLLQQRDLVPRLIIMFFILVHINYSSLV